SCPNVEQTPEHFALECPISQKVWKLALELATLSAKLRVPEHWNDYTGNIKLRNWININAMYEIWRKYTQAKW
ncbi:1576_t:CDS:1, partial [Gigaspora rosea]